MAYDDDFYPSDFEGSDVQPDSDSDFSHASATEAPGTQTFDTDVNRRDFGTESRGLMASPHHHREGHNRRIVN